MTSLALFQLSLERSEWRKNHPFGFVAKPTKNQDGSINLMVWDCFIPGLTWSVWRNGLYHLRLIFKENYPTCPPYCRFVPPLFHPNISLSGLMYTPVLDQAKDWVPTYSIKFILTDIQNRLQDPDMTTPVNFEAYNLYKNDQLAYLDRILQQSRAMIPDIF